MRGFTLILRVDHSHRLSLTSCILNPEISAIRRLGACVVSRHYDDRQFRGLVLALRVLASSKPDVRATERRRRLLLAKATYPCAKQREYAWRGRFLTRAGLPAFRQRSPTLPRLQGGRQRPYLMRRIA